MESGLEGISCLWKSFCRQNLSVDWSDHVNGDEPILIARILKSVHTVVDTGMFSHGR